MISGSLFGLELRRSKFYYISSSSSFFFQRCVKLLLAFLMKFTATSFEFNNEPNFQHKLICDFLAVNGAQSRWVTADM